MKNRGLFVIFFILALFITNIVKASEGISPGTVRQPSFSATGGAATAPSEQKAPAEEKTPTVQEVISGQNKTTPPVSKGAPAAKEEKSWVKKMEESSNKSVNEGAPRTPLTKAISFLIKFLSVIFTLVLGVSLIRILLHLMKQRAHEKKKEEVQQEKPEEPKEANISDAVVAFVRHRLKK